MLHTRRMLGLDAVDTETGRTRLRLIDGTGPCAWRRRAPSLNPGRPHHAHS